VADSVFNWLRASAIAASLPAPGADRPSASAAWARQ